MYIHFIREELVNVEEMTYTSILLTEDLQIRFSELGEEEKERAANQMVRRPLEEFGKVHIVKNN